MALTIYRSTDASAPILSGSAGSIISLLDACLVNGYGSKAAAGWTKAFSSGATIAAYKQGAGSNGMYLRVDDSGVSVGANYARITGYETMTGISLGTGIFPTNAQLNGGLYLYKSNTVDAAARVWILLAMPTCFHLLVRLGASASDQMDESVQSQNGYFFGDIITSIPGDQYNTMIIANTTTGTNTSNGLHNSVTNLNTTITSHYIARSWHQMGESTQVGKFYDYSKSTYPAYPHVVDGKFLASRFAINEPGIGIVRGYLPGFWRQLWSGPQGMWPENQQFNFNTGGLNGRTFEHHMLYTSFTLYEVSDTWWS